MQHREINLGLNKKILLDEDDYIRLKNFKWRLDVHGYAIRSRGCGPNGRLASWGLYSMKSRQRQAREGGCPNIYMHHEILPKKIKFGLEVDHINGNRLDNRKCNLRYATRKQNAANTGPNKGRRFKGVQKKYLKRQNITKYDAVLKGEIIGRFNTELEAAEAYNQRAKEVYGEFARLNEL